MNFVHYDPARVSKVYALEPNAGMIRHAEDNAAVVNWMSNIWTCRKNVYPWWTLVSILWLAPLLCARFPVVAEAIRGLGRILRPGGQFIFFEHRLPLDPQVRRWQKRTEPLFKWMFEACYVTRDIPSFLRQGGFKIEQLDAAYLAPFPKSGSYFFWGLARPES